MACCALSQPSLADCLLLCPSSGNTPDGAWTLPHTNASAGRDCWTHEVAPSRRHLCAGDNGLWKSGTTYLSGFMLRALEHMCTNASNALASHKSISCSHVRLPPRGTLGAPSSQQRPDQSARFPTGMAPEFVFHLPHRRAELWYFSKYWTNGKPGMLPDHATSWGDGFAMIYTIRDPRESVVSLWEWMTFPKTAAPAGARLTDRSFAISRTKEATAKIAAVARKVSGGARTLLVKHSSLQQDRAAVFTQVMQFLGLGASWEPIAAELTSSAQASSDHALMSDPTKTAAGHINFRGAVAGAARFEKRLPPSIAAEMCEIVRSEPIVRRLFLPGGQCGSSEAAVSEAVSATRHAPQPDAAASNEGGARPSKRALERHGKVNIMLLLSDDHPTSAIGAYGGGAPQDATPRLDAFAAEGVLFSNAFATTSLCSPSRASIFTGRYAHAHGQTLLPDFIGGLKQERNPSFARELQRAGWRTGFYGKWHLHGPKNSAGWVPPAGFDDYGMYNTFGTYFGTTVYTPSTFRGAGVRAPADEHETQTLVRLGRRFLDESPPNRSFALVVSFLSTHAPYSYPAGVERADDEVGFRLPQTVHDAGIEGGVALGFPLEWVPGCDAAHCSLGRGAALSRDAFGLHSALARRLTLDVRRTGRALDSAVGSLLDALEQTGRAQSTVVAYTSDQGAILGEHGWWDKRFMVEESIRAPLIVRYPPEIPRGLRVARTVRNVDLASTLLDFARVPPPPQMQGQSWRPLVRPDANPAWDDSLYYRYWCVVGKAVALGAEECSLWRPAHWGLRTPTHKVVFYNGAWPACANRTTGCVELFDLERDPLERRNCARDDPRLTRRLLRDAIRLRTSLGDSDGPGEEQLDALLGRGAEEPHPTRSGPVARAEKYLKRRTAHTRLTS